MFKNTKIFLKVVLPGIHFILPSPPPPPPPPQKKKGGGKEIIHTFHVTKNTDGRLSSPEISFKITILSVVYIKLSKQVINT